MNFCSLRRRHACHGFLRVATDATVVVAAVCLQFRDGAAEDNRPSYATTPDHQVTGAKHCHGLFFNRSGV